MSLKGMYEQADEKTVGIWRNTRSATGIYSFQHAVSQWLFFSKGTVINPAKFPGWDIDGWVINVIIEKNKNASSKHEISLVFDKKRGLDAFWTNFVFISTYCPTEVSLMRGGWEPNIPLCIKTEGAYSVLEVINPVTGEVEYESKKFYKKNAKTMYEEDPEFHKWFDIAVDYSCRERISKGLLKIDSQKFEENEKEEMNNILEENLGIIKEPVLVEESSTPAPKKRGRKKKEEVVVAPSSNDEFLNESTIIEE